MKGQSAILRNEGNLFVDFNVLGVHIDNINGMNLVHCRRLCHAGFSSRRKGGI